MSGPIIRSGPSSRYSQNWEAVFAGKKKAAPTKAAAKATAKKPPRKKRKP
jgi:hypothetical protein